MNNLDPNLRAYLLAFADDEHLMGQAHTEWIGVAPFLEEDLAFASIGQDELGHAAQLYELIDPDIDALALNRDPADYRSCDLAERACTEWAEALVRHWFYDTAEQLRWEALTKSSFGDLGAIAARALREESFHVRHAEALLDALAESTQAFGRIHAAAQTLLPTAVSMFEAPDGEHELLAAGVISSDIATQFDRWRGVVTERFSSLDWSNVDTRAATRDRRSADFGPMYARMREVIMLDPTATW